MTERKSALQLADELADYVQTMPGAAVLGAAVLGPIGNHYEISGDTLTTLLNKVFDYRLARENESMSPAAKAFVDSHITVVHGDRRITSTCNGCGSPLVEHREGIVVTWDCPNALCPGAPKGL